MSDPLSDPLFDLTGMVAVVTGGSRGLGRAMVEAFAARGADVVIASRKFDACERAAAEVVERYGRRALPVACNVGAWDDCGTLIDAAYAEFGKVDILVNNAGMSLPYETPADITEAMWDKVLGVNLKAPFRLAVLAGTRMSQTGGGSIINVSSVAAMRAMPHSLPYAAAKAAVNTLTAGLARAFGPKVRVNTIMGGAFRTDMTASWDLEAFAEHARNEIPLGRIGEPGEIVGAALYFASDASSYSSGAVLQLDGGAL